MAATLTGIRSRLRHITRSARAGLCLLLTVSALMGLLPGCGRGEGSDRAADTVAASADSVVTLTDSAAVSKPAPAPRLTFSGPEEMKAYMEKSPSAARYRMGILPGMVDEAPKYVEALLNNRHPRFLIADKGSMRVIVYDSLGVEIRSFKMAAGKNYGTKRMKRDCRTPEGLFSVRGVYNSTDWLYTDDDGNTSQVKGQFGPRFIRLNIPTTSQIGIHGTCAPWSVGGRRTHGCMRLKNEEILELVALVDSGMPVIVNPSWRDMQINEKEGNKVIKIMTGYADNTRPVPEKQESVKEDSVRKGESIETAAPTKKAEEKETLTPAPEEEPHTATAPSEGAQESGDSVP